MIQDQTTFSPIALDWQPPVRPVVPVLIQVPQLSRSARLARDQREATRTVIRRRRRLRKEIRLGGSVALMLTPLTWALLMLCGGSDPEPPCARAQLMGVEGIGPSFVSTDDSARSVVPVVPALTAPRPQGQPDGPIVLPNYILPDDGSEEPSHAGG